MPQEISAKIRRRIVRENRIYIMPSGRGMLFLAAVVVMVLTAATYNNNLIFILAFFMFALFFVTMLQTHFNLKSVRLQFLSADEAFEGEKITLLFHITQRRSRVKRALCVRSLSRRWATIEQGREDLSPRDSFKPVRLTVQAWKRGIYSIPDVALETYYPLGLFRAWKVFRPAGEMIVYPKPAGRREIASHSYSMGEEELGLRTSPEGDFGELKRYQAGESYHQIAWKHYARTGELFSKVHWGEDHKYYRIPWDPRGTNFEIYLKQMSQWVQQALDDNAAFEMELPKMRVDSGAGRDHARKCWRALASLKEAA